MLNLTEEDIAKRLRQAQTPDNPGGGKANTELPDPTPEQSFKCAAVLLPLLFYDGKWHLLFTRRTDSVESHKGQVSFPGGACDPGEETAEQTALRETQEEIGVSPQDVRLLGRLRDLITVTSFQVTPVVGVIPWPSTLKVSTREVERVFTVPLDWLAERSNRWEFPFPGRRQGLIAYHPFDGELLWGASARITVEFLKTLGLTE
jgi:8-oxo-dGTP pyrophosphatase MutT (NUDIX family)